MTSFNRKRLWDDIITFSCDTESDGSWTVISSALSTNRGIVHDWILGGRVDFIAKADIDLRSVKTNANGIVTIKSGQRLPFNIIANLDLWEFRTAGGTASSVELQCILFRMLSPTLTIPESQFVDEITPATYLQAGDLWQIAGATFSSPQDSESPADAQLIQPSATAQPASALINGHYAWQPDGGDFFTIDSGPYFANWNAVTMFFMVRVQIIASNCYYLSQHSFGTNRFVLGREANNTKMKLFHNGYTIGWEYISDVVLSDNTDYLFQMTIDNGTIKTRLNDSAEFTFVDGAAVESANTTFFAAAEGGQPFQCDDMFEAIIVPDRLLSAEAITNIRAYFGNKYGVTV